MKKQCGIFIYTCINIKKHKEHKEHKKIYVFYENIVGELTNDERKEIYGDW